MKMIDILDKNYLIYVKADDKGFVEDPFDRFLNDLYGTDDEIIQKRLGIYEDK